MKKTPAFALVFVIVAGVRAEAQPMADRPAPGAAAVAAAFQREIANLQARVATLEGQQARAPATPLGNVAPVGGRVGIDQIVILQRDVSALQTALAQLRNDFEHHTHSYEEPHPSYGVLSMEKYKCHDSNHDNGLIPADTCRYDSSGTGLVTYLTPGPQGTYAPTEQTSTPVYGH